MKRTLIIACLLIFVSCKKKETTPESGNTETTIEETISQEKQDSTSVEKKELLQTIDDDTPKLLTLVSSKTINLEHQDYHIHIKYPVLNETVDKNFSIFNEGIKKDFLNTDKLKNQILEDKELTCDTIVEVRSKDKRFIDYKLYKNSDHISVVFLKENHYSGAMHYSYSFDCRNFDLNNYEFLTFEDVFKNQNQMLSVLNNHIRENINMGNIYYDCWEISPGDFESFKNNFVITETDITFYFDDCIICPSYTGTYYVSLSLEELQPLLKKL